VDIRALGNSVVFRIEFKDNYSAGSVLKQIDPAKSYSASALVQKESKYGNIFGQFDSARIRLWTKGDIDNDWDDTQAYPKADKFPDGAEISSIDIRVNKDAREKYGYTQQIDCISNDNSILRIYPGISKYNGWVCTDKNIMTAKLVALKGNYFPGINANFIDINKIDDITTTEWSSTSLYNRTRLNITLEIPANTTYNGYALINEKTNELIYAVKENLTNNTESTIEFSDNIYVTPKFIS
jgi:hypothetical protein